MKMKHRYSKIDSRANRNSLSVSSSGSSWFFSPASLFLLLLSVLTAVEGQIPDQYYLIQVNGTFRCETAGLQCIFERTDFTDTPDFGTSDGTGQEVDSVGGTAWIVQKPAEAVFELNSCKKDLDGNTNGCLVHCDRGCTCTEMEGTSEEGACIETSPVPTISPTPPQPTKAPSPIVCPNRSPSDTITADCPTLMEPGRPSGPPSGTSCDCYNFCNQSFISCCEADTGQCGTLVCDTDPVFGCTDLHKNPDSSDDESSGGSLFHRTATTTAFAIFGVTTAVLALSSAFVSL